MSDYITLQNRIARELRRSNMLADIQSAINDAISEGAMNRLYFNEVRGFGFNTAVGQEYYADLGFTEIDSLWWLNGASRWNMELLSNEDMNAMALGTAPNGPPTNFSRYGSQLRLFPIPNSIIPMNLEGYGKLTPWPLVNNGDTNNWLTEGERYIRAVAKRIVLQDVVKDMSEAALQDAIADDALAQLVTATTLRIGTGVLRSTSF